MAAKSRVSINTLALDNGNVAFRLIHGGDVVAEGEMSPEQVGEMATKLLNSASNAFSRADLTLGGLPNTPKQAVAASRISIGITHNTKQLVAVVEAGQATIALTMPAADLRSFARQLLEASKQANRASVIAHLKDVLHDCSVTLMGTARLVGSQIGLAAARKAKTLRAILLGRSLRIFKRIVIGAGAKEPQYALIGRCIYCGCKDYSAKPGQRKYPLGAEHIVPEGIGGTLELPEASCQIHEDTTGRLVEGDVLGRTLKALRVHLKLKKKGSGPHPKTLPLDAQMDDNKQRIEVPIDDYPVVFSMLNYGPPSFVTNSNKSGRTIDGVRMTVLKNDPKMLYKKYKITSFATASWDNHMLCRMLAKIGHSFAVAELGLDGFRPLLLRCNYSPT
jgi:hypothetical protein